MAKNLTTATAVTSNGDAAPAGLSTAANSDPLQARLRNTPLPRQRDAGGHDVQQADAAGQRVLPTTAPATSDGGYVYGIGGTLPDGTDNGVNEWDMGVMDVAGTARPRSSSVLQSTEGTDASDPSNTVTRRARAEGPVRR